MYPTTNRLHEAYLQIVSPETGRARDISLFESQNQTQLCKGDLKEAKGILQLFMKGLRIASVALTQGKLTTFDAVVGDHNCQVVAMVALKAFKQKEIQSQATLYCNPFQPKQITSLVPIKPYHLLEPLFSPLDLSPMIQYLTYAAILNIGTVCEVRPEGQISIKIDAQKMQASLSKECPPELIPKLVVKLREYLNARTVEIVQNLNKSQLLLPIATQITSHGKFQFPCAFYNVKSILFELAFQGIPFAFVDYCPRNPSLPPLVFVPSIQEKDPFPSFQKVDPKTLESQTPIFVVRVFFNPTISKEEAEGVMQQEGIFPLMLASISQHPQFEDMGPSDYANNEDLHRLGVPEQREIMNFREMGKRFGMDTQSPHIFRVAHVHADTLKYFK